MSDTSARRQAAPPAFPITAEARDAVMAEAASLEREIASYSTEPQDARPRAERLAERLAAMRAVLADAAVVEDDGVAAIGRRVTVIDDDGLPLTYALVLPGDGDPTRGWVSIDSPLGLAVGGRRVGERILVDAPAGCWSAAVTRVA